MYEIVMPQLSDSMDEGKLISWKVKEGQKVNPGDVIAEVESDKAIMEMQSFKSGVVKEITAKEGDVVPVGEVIAKIETGGVKDAKESTSAATDELPVKKPAPKPVVKQEPKPTVKKETKTEPNLQTSVIKHISKEATSGISPKARAKAGQYGIDTQIIAQKTSKSVLHVEDVEEYLREHYFTPKALKLLDKYGLDIATFELNHKIDETEIQEFIANNETPLPQPLSQMQKAIIANVTASAQKPVYHLYEHIDAALFVKNEAYSITAWLIKIFAKVMMAHDSFRARLQNDALIISSNASISVAVADSQNLYMPVVKDANKRSIAEIAKELENFKTKLKENSFTAADMQGSSFSISNLGMLGVERFDAMINKNDSGVVAVGRVNEGKISITLSADHRLINGYEAALFIQDVKQEVQNPLFFQNPH
ncbi:dihydrolipoamide acetyltransferase family protein [Sulfurimonas autotrophica]|uniref:Dihydrolipoamide acetyltransferase component of pyruvate dehydrogenase complex n=1 Tax=Sulfurimonas autotrophica (strain ATCC BAA-671 / DSM 16294 / JCM 11897 / OK10) TaxID=563040 RepID=E0UP70_SULAO|nr:dihydrolipoamide acetyltransferase family protein [Sulfurimonas autotrophica]ADN08534.1 catalytic domain of components of various dehydrogenase complexes [Sulfurimonas autotrophica DSM 16294]